MQDILAKLETGFLELWAASGGGLRADYQSPSPVARWRVCGGGRPLDGRFDRRLDRRFEALAEQAGAILARAASCPAEILAEPDAGQRWLNFLKTSDPGAFSYSPFVVGFLDADGRSGETFFLGSIADVAAVSAAAVDRLLAEFLAHPEPASGDGKRSGKRRTRNRPPATPKPLTAKQVEAVQMVGDCKGNFAEAARRLGVTSKTVRQHYRAAITKTGQTVVKHATKALPSDRRGQTNLADGDDRRR
jgi:DNA-binding CsgD family transcriptional regulator